MNIVEINADSSTKMYLDKINHVVKHLCTSYKN